MKSSSKSICNFITQGTMYFLYTDAKALPPVKDGTFAMNKRVTWNQG